MSVFYHCFALSGLWTELLFSALWSRIKITDTLLAKVTRHMARQSPVHYLRQGIGDRSDQPPPPTTTA